MNSNLLYLLILFLFVVEKNICDDEFSSDTSNVQNDSNLVFLPMFVRILFDKIAAKSSNNDETNVFDEKQQIRFNWESISNDFFNEILIVSGFLVVMISVLLLVKF